MAKKGAKSAPPATKAKDMPKSKAVPKDEDDDDDDEDLEEKKVFGNVSNDDDKEKSFVTAKSKKEDPEDEDDDDEDNEDDDDDEEDEEETFAILNHLTNNNNVGIRIPAGKSIQVIGVTTETEAYPLHLISACLGPDAAPEDRATVVASFFDMEHDHGDDDDNENKEDDEDEEGNYQELIIGTLCRNHCENLALDLMVEGHFILTNTSQETDVFLVGRVVTGDIYDEDEDEDYEEEEEEEDDEDEDEEVDDSRIHEPIEEEDDEEEQKAQVAKQTKEMRKRLNEVANGSGEKRVKPTPVAAAAASNAPKVLDVKSSGKPAGGKVSADEVFKFIMDELKNKKSMKNTDVGTLITKKFGTSFKNLGLEEKSITKFLETRGKGKIVVSADGVKLA